MSIIGRLVYKKSVIFEVFGIYLSEFFIFLHEVFFDSKILPSSFGKHQKFGYGCSSYSGNDAQSLDFCRILTILGELLFRHKPLAYDTDLFMKNQFNVRTFTCSKRLFHDIKF